LQRASVDNSLIAQHFQALSAWGCSLAMED
jgi:hypothetical protein